MYHEGTKLKLGVTTIILPLVMAISAIAKSEETSSLIISIANSSGYDCELISLDYHDCKVTQNAIPQLIQNNSEKFFWIADKAYGFYSRKNENTVTYQCGTDIVKIHSVLEGHCGSKPYGTIDKKNYDNVLLEYNATPSACSNESSGYIMWRIKPSLKKESLALTSNDESESN